jgi:hypothetical protein
MPFEAVPIRGEAMEDHERKSNMEKAEGDRETVEENLRTGSEPKRRSDPRNQEQMVERRPYHGDPTRVESERTSDASTISNGGLGGGRPEGGSRITPERARATGQPDAARKTDSDDPTMPADDATLNTKI